ncbi:hypothetical protein HNW77_10120 [Komagataeibacter sp. AV436]|uniref:DUF4148 domain-containing protein n=1 Tax=Komagataeibacter melomenusus TaxID=2766578 RepID=A0ABX2AEE2_9PROT|nr:hypothetical protein [Komagataeibacter melomenusus]MBV1830033.1 hypothetical protein [Komagataeibacter melomenusus]NPC66743.1 hypothetical protein [Komagataeibacter melomenusus]
MNRILRALIGAAVMCAAPLAHAASPAPHKVETPAPGSNAETADLNEQSLQKARASLQAPAQAASAGHPVQAQGTGQTASPIRVPETGSTVAGY